jgi:hypothetical protein
MCVDLLFFPIHCTFLYFTYPSCSSFVYFNNPYFSPSIMVNLFFHDYTSKLKLPIIRLIIAIVWNISTILLHVSMSFAIYLIDLGVKLCGVSSLKTYFDNIPLSFIYNLKLIFNKFPSTDLGNTIVGGLNSVNDGSSATICGSWGGCDYCWSICGCTLLVLLV